MNITQTEKQLSKSTGDMLEEIFEAQRMLHKKYTSIERKNGIYIPDKVDVDNCKDQYYLKDLFYRIVSELVEASETLKNKPWKQSQMITDKDHLKEELSDAFHFFIELCIKLDIGAEELYNLYFKKNEVNQWRVKTKY